MNHLLQSNHLSKAKTRLAIKHKKERCPQVPENPAQSAPLNKSVLEGIHFKKHLLQDQSFLFKMKSNKRRRPCGLTLARTRRLTRVGPEQRSAALIELGGEHSKSEKRNVETLKIYTSVCR